MKKLPKSVEDAVCFAQWCVNNKLTDKIREVGELRVAVNQRADTWCKQNNGEIDFARAEAKIDRLEKEIDRLAHVIGLTDLSWPGLYPTFTTPAYRESMLPEVGK